MCYWGPVGPSTAPVADGGKNLLDEDFAAQTDLPSALPSD